MTTLKPMRAEAFPAFFERAVAVYAAESVAARRWSEAEAPDLARAANAKLLPEGIATAGQDLFEIVADGVDEPVGSLWVATMPRGSLQVLFVCQIDIEPGHRRQGHARRALQAAEAFAAAQGLAGMALHVFAHNTGAQALYRALGYEVASLNLFKSLGRGDAGVTGAG